MTLVNSHRTRSNRPRPHKAAKVALDPRRLIERIEELAWHQMRDPLVVEVAAHAASAALDEIAEVLEEAPPEPEERD